MNSKDEEVMNAAAGETTDASGANARSAGAPQGAASTEATGDSALGQLQNDLERFRDLALRSKADFDNYRKRAAREKEEAVKYANASLLERLIGVVDNFELGLNAARESAGSAPIVAGMEMVAKQLNDFLSEQGVAVIDATAQPFDPNLHEALSQEASAEVPEGVVLRQIRKGYKLRDRLLRPANVIVSKGAA